ncbi:MAG: phosphoglucosamine mutase [Candidatus Adiutrix sp.]|jgi:phosphoglucosamine mutase|nr:phosphoglucosamine mutase [Candidatus Adiutrix sp.]
MTQPRRKLFGTDGIRGVVNQYPMTAEFALNLGRALAHLLNARLGKPRRPKVVIGKDTRLSGYMLEEAFSGGLLAQGADVYLAGPLPTPGIAFLTASLRADAGVVISASHNPYLDNGIKIFAGDGFKLPDETEAALEETLDPALLDRHRPKGDGVGKAARIDDAVGRYVVYLKSAFPRHMSLEGLTMVLDCAHGAGYRAAPLVFEELGAKVRLFGARPDGVNINLGVGSLHPELCVKKVGAAGADLGLALDGDADRAIFVDGRGRVVDGDQIMHICASRLKKKDRLRKNAIAATIMSNMGLEIALNEAGIDLVRTRVGDRYVVERMRRDGLNFGGEQSGHLIFLDHGTTGDGIMAALQTLAAMIDEDKPLAELAGRMTPFPQVLLNVKAARPAEVADNPAICEQVKKVADHLGKKGRIVLRPSGTEPVVRVMVEGENMAEVAALAEETADLVARELCI